MDENESWEHFILPEMLGRATSNLSIITFNYQDTTSETSSILQKEFSVRQMVEKFSKHMTSFDYKNLKELKGLRKMDTNSEELLRQLKKSNYYLDNQ